MPPLIHDVWIASIFEPAVPELKNTDGEDMVITRSEFTVTDSTALKRALDAASSEGIERDGNSQWTWVSSVDSGKEVSLGKFELHEPTLTIETNSVQRGVRACELVERLAGTAIQHRSTLHEDLRRRVMEGVTAKILGKEEASEQPEMPAIDPDIAEALVAQYHATHYRAWIDIGVPALDGKTPREAAKIAAYSSRVADLMFGLEGMYEQALKDGQPAYDPSWMWAELGLDDPVDESHPPLSAHERVAAHVPGSAEISRAAAERFRAAPTFDDKTSTIGDEEFRNDLDLQRFIRKEQPAANETGHEGAVAAPYLQHMVNFDLHRRKIFWVDAALTYMLENTDIDLVGRELRVPFPSFAIVLTDRHALSLGERLLARSADDPLRGQILRVATVYVTEQHRGSARVLSIVFALDALGADLPSLVGYEVPADEESSVSDFLESMAPRPVVVPEVRDVFPARRLLRLVLNAILYSTSAGVAPEARTASPPTARQPHSSSALPRSSDSVFFLPGKIDIRQVRRLQEIERGPEGGVLLTRFMVRGHWRRAQKKWTDQRLRWIEPYWKGPDMAAVIEKAYRLKP